MPKTFSALLNQVNDEIGFDLPSSYIGNTDSNVRQLVALANKTGQLLRDLRLQYLIRQSFINLASIADGGQGTVDLAEDPDGRISWYPFPSDFYCVVPDTSYQNGRIDVAEWPTPAYMWAYLISRTGPQTLRVRVRTIKDRIYVFSPDASQLLQFEYISSQPITVATTGITPSTVPTTSDVFTTDADTWDLDDVLFEGELKWRYKKEKGLDYQQDMDDARLYRNELRARDSNATTIRFPWAYPWPGQPYANLWVQN